MMLDRSNLAFGRQQLVQVPAPTRRVFAVAIVVSLRPIEYLFNATAQATRCLRLVVPNWLKHLHDKIGATAVADFRHWQRTNYWISVCRQRRRPLRRVFWIRPSC